MTLTPDQAAEALKDIEVARSRTRTGLNYREGGLHLILWGAVIIAGHLLTDFRPAAAQTIWIAANGLGAAEAALTEPFAVGEHAVAAADLRDARAALVVGCGPVGLAVIAALKLRGFGPVIAADFASVVSESTPDCAWRPERMIT